MHSYRCKPTSAGYHTFDGLSFTRSICVGFSLIFIASVAPLSAKALRRFCHGYNYLDGPADTRVLHRPSAGETSYKHQSSARSIPEHTSIQSASDYSCLDYSCRNVDNTICLASSLSLNHLPLTRGDTYCAAFNISPELAQRIQQYNSTNRMVSTTRNVISAAISPLIKGAKELAVWVAIAFTIASFVRDYLGLTSGPSAEEKYQLHLGYRSACEDDLRRGQHSHDCDLELSKPTSPPPGLVKRTEPDRKSQHKVGLVDYRSQWAVTLIVLAVMVAMSAVQKMFNKSRNQTPKPYLAEYTTSPSMDGRNGTQPRPSSHPQPSPIEHAFIPTGSQSEKWSDTLKLLSLAAIFAYSVSSLYSGIPEMKRLSNSAELVPYGIRIVLGLLFMAPVCFLAINYSYSGVVAIAATAVFITVNVIIFSDTFISWFLCHPTQTLFIVPSDLIIQMETSKNEILNRVKT